MTPCITSNNAGAVTVPSGKTINCKLEAGTPNIVTIVEAKVFQPKDSNTGTACALVGAQGFTIPKLQQGTARLIVTIQGSSEAIRPVFVVEDCDDQTVLLSIISAAQIANVEMVVS
ncbi:MAG: hypothetical protein ABSC48_19690 [Terracidiphilus sp.]